MTTPPSTPPPYSDTLLGTINVGQSSLRGMTQETLFFTSGGIIVAMTGAAILSQFGPVGTAVQFQKAANEREKLSGFSAENILKANEKNFAIANYEIKRVVLKKRTLGGINISIATDQKEYTWFVVGAMPGQNERKFEDFVGFLQVAVPDKLQVIK